MKLNRGTCVALAALALTLLGMVAAGTFKLIDAGTAYGQIRAEVSENTKRIVARVQRIEKIEGRLGTIERKVDAEAALNQERATNAKEQRSRIERALGRLAGPPR